MFELNTIEFLSLINVLTLETIASTFSGVTSVVFTYSIVSINVLSKFLHLIHDSVVCVNHSSSYFKRSTLYTKSMMSSSILPLILGLCANALICSADGVS